MTDKDIPKVKCGNCNKEEKQIQTLHYDNDYHQYLKYEIPMKWDYKIIDGKRVLLCDECEASLRTFIESKGGR